MLVHCDYTAESGPLRVKQLLPEEADEKLQRRVAFFNVWEAYQECGGGEAVGDVRCDELEEQ